MISRREMRELLRGNDLYIEQITASAFYLSPEERSLLLFKYSQRVTWSFLEFRLHLSRATLTRIDAQLIDKLRETEQGKGQE